MHYNYFAVEHVLYVVAAAAALVLLAVNIHEWINVYRNPYATKAERRQAFKDAQKATLITIIVSLLISFYPKAPCVLAPWFIL